MCDKKIVKVTFDVRKKISEDSKSPRRVPSSFRQVISQASGSSENDEDENETHSAREFVSLVTLLCWARKVVCPSSLSAYVSCLPAVCSALNKKDSCTCARRRNGNAPRKGRRSFVPPTMAPDSRRGRKNGPDTPCTRTLPHARKKRRRWLVTAVQLVHRDRLLTIGKAISPR